MRGARTRGVGGAADVRMHGAACRAVEANVAVSDYLRSRLGLPRIRTIYSLVSDAAFAAATDATGEDGLVVCLPGSSLRRASSFCCVQSRWCRTRDWRSWATVRWRRLTETWPGNWAYPCACPSSAPNPSAAFPAYARASVVCIPTTCEEAFHRRFVADGSRR